MKQKKNAKRQVAKTQDQQDKQQPMTEMSPEQKQALELVKACIAGVTVGYIPLKQLQDALEQFKLSLESTKKPWE